MLACGASRSLIRGDNTEPSSMNKQTLVFSVHQVNKVTYLRLHM